MKEFRFRDHTEHDYSQIAALQQKPPQNRKFRIFLFTLVLASGVVIYSFLSQLQNTRCKAIVRVEFRTAFAVTRGYLTRVFYGEGLSFKKGDLLAEMDKSALNSEIVFLKGKIQLVKSAIHEKHKLAEEADLYNQRKWNWQREERKKKLEAQRFQLELGEKEADQKILELKGKLAQSSQRIKHYKRLVLLKAATIREHKGLEKEEEAFKNKLAYWKQRLTGLSQRKLDLAEASKVTAPLVKANIEGISLLKIKLSDLNRQMEEVKQKLKFNEIRAHSDGIILEILKREGEELKENEALLTFYQKDTLWLEAYTPPNHISKVTVGSRVDLINAEGKLIAQAGQVVQIMPRLTQLPRELLKSGYDNKNYYRVKIHLNRSVVRPVFLYPGSPLDVSISGGSFLRKPSAPAWL